MGLGGISLWQLLIVLLIVVVIFGTRKLSSMGSDLGGAVKGFRKAMSDSEQEEDEEKARIDNPDAEFRDSETTGSEESRAESKHNS